MNISSPVPEKPETKYGFRLNRNEEDLKKAIEIFVDGKFVGYVDWFNLGELSDGTIVVGECGVPCPDKT